MLSFPVREMPLMRFIDKIRSRGEEKRSRIKIRTVSKKSSPPAPRVTCLKHTTLLSLNDDLLARIYEHLQPVDKVCLSLICKRLFALFGAISKQPWLSFPNLLSLRVPIMCVNSEDVPRNQLLLRLEDGKRAYCGDCLKLHPRKEFDQAALKESSVERSCGHDAGVVDLCPCIALTTRDRDKVINLLRSGSPLESKYGSFRPGPAAEPSFFHTCSMAFGPSGNIELVMWIYLQSSGCLFAQSQYTITAPNNHLRHATAEPIFGCPHKDLMSLVRSDKRFALCSECGTFMSKVSEESDKNLNTLVIQVKRPLDGYGYVTESIWSKASWRNTCRLNRSQFAKNGAYWSQSHQLKAIRKGIHGRWEAKYCSTQTLKYLPVKLAAEKKLHPREARKGYMPSISEVSSVSSGSEDVCRGRQLYVSMSKAFF